MAPLGGCGIELANGDVEARSGDTVMPRCLLFINRLSSCVASPPRPNTKEITDLKPVCTLLVFK